MYLTGTAPTRTFCFPVWLCHPTRLLAQLTALPSALIPISISRVTKRDKGMVRVNNLIQSLGLLPRKDGGAELRVCRVFMKPDRKRCDWVSALHEGRTWSAFCVWKSTGLFCSVPALILKITAYICDHLSESRHVLIVMVRTVVREWELWWLGFPFGFSHAS